MNSHAGDPWEPFDHADNAERICRAEDEKIRASLIELLAHQLGIAPKKLRATIERLLRRYAEDSIVTAIPTIRRAVRS